MRLWHKDLIQYLPRQQLLGQWRECCMIAKNIAEKGTPNHILVNKIMNYPMAHFVTYGTEVADEMRRRSYQCNSLKFYDYFSWSGAVTPQLIRDGVRDLAILFVPHEELFSEWHNDNYFRQCYYNLQEKYECGGIPEIEWRDVCAFSEMFIRLSF